jgi:hypothetical protein
VVSVTVGWDVAPMWPRGPLGGQASMLNRIKAMWARLWRRRGRRTSEHEFYDQHEASRYRSDAEARGHWNPPGGDSL